MRTRKLLNGIYMQAVSLNDCLHVLLQLPLLLLLKGDQRTASQNGFLIENHQTAAYGYQHVNTLNIAKRHAWLVGATCHSNRAAWLIALLKPQRFCSSNIALPCSCRKYSAVHLPALHNLKPRPLPSAYHSFGPQYWRHIVITFMWNFCLRSYAQAISSRVSHSQHCKPKRHFVAKTA